MHIKYTCNKCEFSKEIAEAIYLYEFPEEIGVISRPCWCHNCNSLSSGEYIPSEQEVLSEADAWNKEDPNYNYVFAMGPILEVTEERKRNILKYYNSLASWARNRKSPGKCLSCGDTSISLAGDFFSDLNHYGCGGLLTCTFTIAGTIGKKKLFVYSSEGNKIKESTVIA